MSVLSWLYRCLVFGMEVFLINKYYWGLNTRKAKVFCGLLILLGGVVSYFLTYTTIIGLEFNVIWGVFLAFVVFDIGVIEALKYSIFVLLLASIWNNMVWGVSLFFVRDMLVIRDEKSNLLCGVIAFFLVIVITIFLYYKELLPLRVLQDISKGQSVLLFIGLTLVNFFFAMMQGFLVGEMTPNLARHAVAFCILTVVFVIFIFFYLIQTIQKKNFLEQVNKLEESYLHSQTSYYERVMIQDEELRKFRHDIRHHFFVLGRLSEEDRMDELKEYVGRLQESGVTKSVSYTGHTLIDALFSQIFQKHIQAEDISFSFHGKIPSTFSLENSPSVFYLPMRFRMHVKSWKNKRETENLRWRFAVMEGIFLLSFEIRFAESTRFLCPVKRREVRLWEVREKLRFLIQIRKIGKIMDLVQKT